MCKLNIGVYSVMAFKTLGLEIPTTQMLRRRQNELQTSFMKDEADVTSHKMLYITH